MPTSVDIGKSFIKEWVDEQDDITRIVDVGAGNGMYRRLIKKKDYVWTAIEIWAPYISLFKLDRLYDDVIVGDIRYLNIPKADLIIFGDVLEHLTPQDATKVLRKSQDISHCIISMPLSRKTDREYLGNFYESHADGWTEDIINKIADDFDIHKVFENDEYINKIHVMIR